MTSFGDLLLWLIHSVFWKKIVKLRERAKGRPRKVIQRSFKDGGCWMVDILSLMLYTKFGYVTFHPPTHPPEVSKSPGLS